MPDDQEMYLTLVRATEQAIQLLVQSQQEAEEIYLSAPDPEITLFRPADETQE